MVALGFRAQYQPSELTRCVLGILEKAVEWSEEVHVVNTHLTETYDRVLLPLLQMTLEASGAPTQLIRSLLRCNTESKVSFVAPGIVCYEHLWVGQGLPQRDPASLALFVSVLEHVLRPLMAEWREEVGDSNWVRMVGYLSLR